MPRTPLVVGNWKMNHTQSAARVWCENYGKALADGAGAKSAVTLGIAPPFTTLAALIEARGRHDFLIGAQNVHWESSGAFTGEIAPGMLNELGCDFVILGHSERRHVFGESDERIAKKVAAAREAGLTPFLCVGEKEDERDSGRTELVIENQLRAGLQHVELTDASELVIAYEPVWAIGTGRTATTEQAQEAHHFLRQILGSIAGAEIADGVRIQYGGSVKPGNAAELAAMPDIDGFLVGGASLDAASLLAIARGFDL